MAKKRVYNSKTKKYSTVKTTELRVKVKSKPKKKRVKVKSKNKRRKSKTLGSSRGHPR